MFRAVLGTVLAFIVMLFLVGGLLAGAFAAFGADRAYEPGTYDPTLTWIVATLVLGFLAAIVGGVIAAKVGGPRAVRILTLLVLALGGVTLVAELTREKEATEVRTADVSLMESARHGRQPLWVCVVNPLVGVLGVALGARKAGAKRKG